MARPVDWSAVDLGSDPVPGDAVEIRRVSHVWGTVADDADLARSRINSLLGDDAVVAWIGKAGDAFRSHSSKLPGQLAKCADSYAQASDALSWWAGQLESCQASADKGLMLARAAQADLASANSRLGTAEANASSAAAASEALKDQVSQAKAGSSGAAAVTAPDPSQVSAAVSRATAANQAVAAAQGGVHDAQARLDAAKKMVADAASLRDQHGSTTSSRLHKAADAGIGPDSFWHKLGDALAEVWHVVIEVAKIVVLVGGIIAIIIGGPIAWIVVAAAVLVLADTVAKYIQGKATLWDVALAALSCIPITKGLTTLSGLVDIVKGGLSSARELLPAIAGTVRAFGRSATSFVAAGGAFAKSLAADIADIRVVVASTDFGAMAMSVGKSGSQMLGDAKSVAGAAKDAALTGPVEFTVPAWATEEEIAQMHEYVDAANRALDSGQLSEAGRVKVPKGSQLASDKEAAAAAERIRAAKAGTPYDGVAAHLPDTTWSGTAEPPQGWADHTLRINSSIGSQSSHYPVGWKPTRFGVKPQE